VSADPRGKPVAVRAISRLDGREFRYLPLRGRGLDEVIEDEKLASINDLM
jgi:hypothetical protein